MNTFVTLSLILGASALTIPRSSCSFELTASCGESGTIGQLSDGQNRIGGGLSAATFNINNGGIVDSAGRGCILTPSVEQFKCDQGVGPTYGFTIDSNETLTFQEALSSTLVQPRKQNGICTPRPSLVKRTASIAPSLTTVTVYDCGMASSASLAASAPAVVQSLTLTPAVQSSTLAASIPVASPATSSLASVPIVLSNSAPIETVSTPVESSSSAIIPTPIETTSVWAHTYVSSTPETIVTPLISTSSIIKPAIQTTSYIPVSTTLVPSTIATTSTSIQTSSTCVATSLTGSSTSGKYQYPHLITPISSSSPSTAAGTSYYGTITPNTSTLFNFDIPTSYSGRTCNLIFLLPLLSELETSSYTFSGSGAVDFSKLSTAWDNTPSVEKDLGTRTLKEGSSTLVESFECPAGEAVSFEMSAVGSTALWFSQDWNPSPLGLYVTVC